MKLSLPIETPRLLLRRYQMEDAENIFQTWASDPEVTPYLSWHPHKSLDDTYEFLSRMENSWKDRSHLAFGIESKASGRLIGGIGFGVEAQVRIQFGYVLSRQEWGKGYTTEALRGLIPVAFSEPQIHRVYALCYVENKSSARVMQKAGMSYEGVLRKYYILPNLSTEIPCDMACYSLLREEFEHIYHHLGETHLQN